MTSPSGVPAPHPGDGVKPATPAPGPAVVPPKHHPRKRRTALWGLAVALVLLAGGATVYFKSKSDSKLAGGGPGFMVPTMAGLLGGLFNTIPVNGRVWATDLAAPPAPRSSGGVGVWEP